MDIKELREQIDQIDAQLLKLFEQRMLVAREIGIHKKAAGRPIYDPVREAEKIEMIRASAGERNKEEAAALFEKLMELSRDFQKRELEKVPLCGLLGKKLSHSYSPQIHHMLGDYPYLLFEKEEEEIEAFLQEGSFTGLNVTIPYKRTVIPYLDEISGTARRMNSVNTIVRRDGKLIGDNTDAYGFAELVKHSGIDVKGKKTLVLGSGGGSSAVQAALAELGAEIVVISRSGENNYDNLDRHADAQIIVNTTPLGMYPDNGEAAVDLRQFPALTGVLDIVYNPAETAILLQAETLGIPHANGLYMLVAQAKRASELFLDKQIDDSVIGEIETVLAGDMTNIILIGMPGSGKTTVARKLGEILDREVLDSDAVFEQKTGMEAGTFIEMYGEAAFREEEAQIIADLGKLSGKVIATGGGVVTREENYNSLHQNGVIVWLARDLARLAKEGRPLSQGSPEGLYAARSPLYERFADFTVDNNGSVEDSVTSIRERVTLHTECRSTGEEIK